MEQLSIEISTQDEELIWGLLADIPTLELSSYSDLRSPEDKMQVMAFSTDPSAIVLAEQALNRLCSTAPAILAQKPNYFRSQIESRNYLTKWHQDFPVLEIAPGQLYIVPIWEQDKFSNPGLAVFIDPGLAFGSGMHFTTQFCLRALLAEQLMGCSVLDLGCGSGILTCAAQKLGAKSVKAIDYDPEAVIAAKNNLQLNKLSADDVYESSLEDLDPSAEYDLVVANMTTQVVMGNRRKIANFVKPGGRLILSGICSENTEMVKASFLDQFRIVTEEMGDQPFDRDTFWSGFVMQKQTNQ